jgi:YHS domain-containing protein
MRWFAGLLLLALVGCSGSSDSGKPAEKTSTPTKKTDHTNHPTDGEHGHKSAQHGGILVRIGSDSYHAEAVFEKGGIIRLYTLGKEVSKILEVDAQPLNAFVKIEGAAESQSIIFRPEPQADDAKEKTSLFVVHLPREFWGQSLEVTIPSMRIGGERFRLGFKSIPDKTDRQEMPAKLADEEERKLFLTPGGKYTEADIAANGKTTASVTFKGIKPEHDVKPKVGDLLCPISMTKANPKFSWVVGGQTYQFCCPPCVETQPEQIKEAEAYRKK